MAVSTPAFTCRRRTSLFICSTKAVSGINRWIAFLRCKPQFRRCSRPCRAPGISVLEQVRRRGLRQVRVQHFRRGNTTRSMEKDTAGTSSYPRQYQVGFGTHAGGGQLLPQRVTPRLQTLSSSRGLDGTLKAAEGKPCITPQLVFEAGLPPTSLRAQAQSASPPPDGIHRSSLTVVLYKSGCSPSQLFSCQRLRRCPTPT